MKFLFKPGWLALFLLVAGFAYLAFAVLAPWQLGKNVDTQQRNDAITAAAAKAPESWDSLIDTDGALRSDAEWRRLSLRGEYLPEQEFLLRNRAVDGAPGLQVVTPFRTSEGHQILINRGFVAQQDGSALPEISPAPGGTVELEGRLRNTENAATSVETIASWGRLSATSLNTQQLAGELDLQLSTPFVELGAQQPGVLLPIPLPALESGPYLSYGLQWIAFGVMAPLAVAYFVYAEIKARREERQEAAVLAGAGLTPTGEPLIPDPALEAAGSSNLAQVPTDSLPATDSGSVKEPVTQPAGTLTVEEKRAQKLRERYGTSEASEHRKWAVGRRP